jgi:hypothetical protein
LEGNLSEIFAVRLALSLSTQGTMDARASDFVKAEYFIRNAEGGIQADNSQKLLLYGLFKQAKQVW